MKDGEEEKKKVKKKFTDVKFNVISIGHRNLNKVFFYININLYNK